jgi:hypothetical protein
MAPLVRNSQIRRRCAPSPPASRSAQAPRRIGATSVADAICCGSCAVLNTALRFFFSRSSARVTISIMRS